MAKIKLLENSKNIQINRNEQRQKGNIKNNSENNNENREENNDYNLHSVKEELHNLVGLKNVKETIEEICAFIEIQKKREKEKLATESQTMHMIFRGNPGTGKTTVARILSRLFRCLDILPQGHTLEVERADLVGEYIGHTAQKTREQIKKAKGGILFIDEAYSLARGGNKDFGRETIDALVKGMEDNKDNLILVLAGYKNEMQFFLDSNPGLRSRFPIQIDFPDYSTEDLLRIADMMLEDRDYYLDIPARDELRQVINSQSKMHQHSGNARLVRNIIERVIRVQAVRLVNKGNCTKEELMKITRRDIAGTRNIR